MSLEDKILELVKQADPANPTAYVRNIVKQFSREKLDNHILSCMDCSVCSNMKSITSGNINGTVMIIGDYADLSQKDNDIKTAEWYPLMQKVIDYYGINEEELFFVNAVNCIPCQVVDNKEILRTPSKTEVENCKTFLDYAIEIMRPFAIIILGNIALNTLKKISLQSTRGQWIDVCGIQAMPTYHPRYVLEMQRSGNEELVEDLKIDFCDDIKSVLTYVKNASADSNLLLKNIEEL